MPKWNTQEKSRRDLLYWTVDKTHFIKKQKQNQRKQTSVMGNKIVEISSHLTKKNQINLKRKGDVQQHQPVASDLYVRRAYSKDMQQRQETCLYS